VPVYFQKKGFRYVPSIILDKMAKRNITKLGIFFNEVV
jgi:hypothetical protein